MKILTGNLEILESGVAFSSGLNDVDFVIAESPRMVIGVRVQKKDGEKPSIEMKIEDESKAIFVFTNPDSLNFGPSEPVDVGVFGGRQLSATLRVSIFGDYSSFEVAYAFFLGGAIK